MKKFIKALEDKGIMKGIVDSAIITENITGCHVNQNGLEMILDFHMMKDEDLEDIFLQEAHAIAVKSVFKYVEKQIAERQKVEAMNGVDFDALFAKATGKTPSNEDAKKEESKDLDAKIEDIMLESLSKALDEIFDDILKKMVNDCK
jgi:hypothetical protein